MRSVAGPAKCSSRRWTPKASTPPCCFPPVASASSLSPTKTRVLPRRWRAPTTIGCMISVYDIDDAVSETRRVAEEYNFRSVFLRSNIVNGKNWYDPYYEPLWNLLEELNLPLGFHEASASRSRQCAENFEPNFGLRRVYAQPFEQMMGMGAFLGGGILERHPKMKVAFLEANCSWLPWLLWRLDEGYEREGDIFMQDLTMAPSEYFKRQCFISVEPDEAPARHTIEEI